MKHFLFDFNGTLFNDTSFHIQAWHDFLSERFGLELTREEVMKSCIGPNNETIFANLIGTDYSVEQIAAFSAEKEQKYRSIVLSDAKNKELINGVAEAFDYLVEHAIPFAIATASPLENVLFYLNDLGLNRWTDLDHIVYEDGHQRGKPYPDFYIEAARRINTVPCECVIFEDSPTGIQAAINAKAGKIVVVASARPIEELKHFSQISEIITDFKGFMHFI